MTPSSAASTPIAAQTRPWFRRVSLGRYTGVVVALVLVGLYLTLTQSVFLTWDNLMNIVKSNSVIFVLAVGATFVVISGGIDLSTASATTATAMIFALAMKGGWGLVPSLLVAIAFGSGLGIVNGVLITRFGISFLVVTLGALSIWASFALVVNNGETASVFTAKGFGPIKDFVNNGVGSVPLLLIFDAAVALLASGLLRYTTFGRALFATGSNQEAARLNGINISRVLIGVYAMAGLCAALASIVQVGRLTAASSTPDPTLLLTVLAAVLIGGTSFTGGGGGHPRHGHRGAVPRRGPERSDPQRRLGVLAGDGQRRHPDRRGRPRGAARSGHDAAVAQRERARRGDYGRTDTGLSLVRRQATGADRPAHLVPARRAPRTSRAPSASGPNKERYP